MSLNVAMIITAAGRSTRFPPNKLLEKLEDRSAIEHSLATFANFDMDIYVVLGYQADRIQELLEARFGDRLIFVYNPDFIKGLSTSVICGVRAASAVYDYWGFCPGDKPFIQRKTVSRLLQELDKQQPGILIPRYQNKPGHPSFFSTEMEAELLALSGDSGARQLYSRFPEKTLMLTLEDEGISLDMDYYLEFESGR